MAPATYPVLSRKPYSIELEIEGEKTIISYDLSKKVLTVTHGQKTLLEAVKKDALKKHKVDVAGHEVEIFCKMAEILNVIPNEGLSVRVDGKPVQGTLADPANQLKNASYALYVLAGFYFLSFLSLAYYDEAAAIVGALVGTLLVVLGLNIQKIPRISTSLGSALGCFTLLGYVMTIATGQKVFGLFQFILIGGATLTLLQGFILAMKRGNSPLLMPKNHTAEQPIMLLPTNHHATSKPDAHSIKSQSDWTEKVGVGSLVIGIVLVAIFIVVLLLSPVQPINS